MEGLEDRFERRMREIYEQAADECNYRPTRFLQMVNERGGLETAKIMLSKDDHPEGLTRLWEEGRLDISMEAAVLQEPWCALFTEAELGVARKRLKSLGYDFDE